MTRLPEGTIIIQRDNGRLLNLTAHEPQKWTTIIEIWGQMVCRKYDELDYTKTPVEMYSYLEKFLGEAARAVWESYKLNYPQDFSRDLELGDNPYNFVNKVRLLLLEDSPNANYGQQQIESIKKLEQLQIKNWTFIKPFLLDFMYYSNEYVSDTESIYSIISYPDPDNIENYDKSSRKYKDWNDKNLNQLDQFEDMLTYLDI
ncbi:hypothetical protein IHE45_02G027600 [Dioscorea alata]|uniref:Uncharacterized protein n=1 Tax=Dioscorea alata TaxID=55571 RepID=A0ACB7WP96_DIOAL|nr:hypothetical protein IHE45_02G027600 [Dioscorea alata]